MIETPVPECEIWNFQLDNYWMESLDYRYLPACSEQHTARYERGRLAEVRHRGARSRESAITWTRPDMRPGTMLLRWTRAKTHPKPRCRVVKLAALPGGPRT